MSWTLHVVKYSFTGHYVLDCALLFLNISQKRERNFHSQSYVFLSFCYSLLSFFFNRDRISNYNTAKGNYDKQY